MLKKDIRQFIVTPSLKAVGLWSEAADILVYATGVVETNYEYLMQIGTPKDGAIGCWQMQPSDARRIKQWLNLPKNTLLKERVLSTCYYVTMPVDDMALASNLVFGAIMCRLHYAMINESLPPANDAVALSSYHKRRYNGNGKADPGKNMVLFREIIERGY